ncbi:MAG: PadR family transcriptional regulator [Hyphomicrobiales bacterium]
MSRQRSTPYAILGLLELLPMSGYDIRKQAAESIGYFWSESYGQIYPTLRDLTADGLIRPLPKRGRGGRERRVYEITERGRGVLREWKLRAPGPMPVRNELLLKLFFADASTAGTAAAWIDDLAAQEKARLATIDAIRHRIRDELPGHPSTPYWLATLSYGEHRARAALRWCHETRRTLRHIADESNPGTPPGGKE